MLLGCEAHPSHHTHAFLTHAFLRFFASDRKHHPRRIDNAWNNSPPPKLPCIVTEQNWQNSMHRYLDMAIKVQPSTATLQSQASGEGFGSFSKTTQPQGGVGEEGLSLAEKLQLEDDLRYGQVMDEASFLSRFGAKMSTAQ